jgi:hypothetical protein
MKKEFKRIKGVSRKIVGDTHYKKIRKLKTYEDKTEGLKYLVSSKLRLKLMELESKLGDEQHENVRLIELKLILLPSKIEIFKSTFNERDYIVVERLINEIESELKND